MHTRGSALPRSLLPAWNLCACAWEVLRSQRWHSACRRGSWRAVSPRHGTTSSSLTVGKEARGETPDLPALPPPEVRTDASLMLSRLPWHARAHTHKRKDRKSPFGLIPFTPCFILNFYHLKNIISVPHWAHPQGWEPRSACPGSCAVLGQPSQRHR